MKAVCWEGKEDVRVQTVPDPSILNPRDAILRVTSTAICGSDLHLYGGKVPTMKSGDILGHEFMGEIVEIGPAVTNLKKGDRVVVPFPIACGDCYHCRHDLWSGCENSNPNAGMLEGVTGYSGSGIFGYTHLYGGYAGGQAEYVRVPYADVGPIKVPNHLADDQVLFLSDILPTGYEAIERVGVGPGDVVAVWGCGPVGQFSIRSAFMVGADRVIAIDRFQERLDLAAKAGAETINYEDTEDMVELLKQMTGGRGPDKCIDAVGMEAHGTNLYGKLDRVKQALKLEMDNASVLRQCIQACGMGGAVSVIGVYLGFVDKFPMGTAFAKGLSIRAGQCNAHKYLQPLMERIEQGDIKPEEIITHRGSLADAPDLYKTFQEKDDKCIKVVMKPAA